MTTTDDFSTPSDDLQRRLQAWMRSTAPTHEPAGLITGAVARTASVRQRPAVLVRSGLGSGRLALPVLSPRARLVMLVVMSLALLGAALVVGSALLRPAVVDRSLTPQPPPLTQAPPTPTPQPSPSFALVPAGRLTTPRDHPTLITLLDGRVLILGGGAIGHAAEIYDPATGRALVVSVPPPGMDMAQAAPLPDGRVLVISWISGEPASKGRSVALLFDPGTASFAPTGPMMSSRFQPAIVDLADGRILVSGGVANPEAGPLATSEIYDPKTATFSATGRMASTRFGHAMARLDDGRVLVVGGCSGDAECLTGSSAEIFDPSTGTFAPTGVMDRARTGLDALRLLDGRVLVLSIGQKDTMIFGHHGIDPISAELFDPRSGTFSEAPPLPHTVSTATLLGNGLVLATGHWDLVVQRASADGSVATTSDQWLGLYDPVTGEMRASLDPITGVAGLSVDTDHSYQAAALLRDGGVLLLSDYDTQAPDPSANVIDIFRASP